MADEVPHNPGRVVARLARQVELAVCSVELTLSQYRVLGILGDGCEASSALADKLAVSRPSITGVVDGLVARGLVRRDQVGGDRRRIDVALTDEGSRLLAAADAQVEQRLIEIANHLDDARTFSELDGWRPALDAFRDSRRECRRQTDVDR